VHILKKATLLFLLVCAVSCSGEAAGEQKYHSAANDFLTKSAATIPGKYFSVQKGSGQTDILRMVDIKSFTKDRVVYDFVEYEFNKKPSDQETMGNLGAVSVSDPNPTQTMQRRQARLPTPYGLTGATGVEQRGVEAPLTMGKPNEKALSCYRYTALSPQTIFFEFCEGGYRGVRIGLAEYRHQADYEPKSIVAEVFAANPGFPEKTPSANSGRSAAASGKPEPQSVVTDIRYDGEIIGRAAVCLDNRGQLPAEEGNKIGAAYLHRLTMTYGREDAAPFFYIFKEALTVGEKAQQKEGMADCDERIAAFDELAKIIGYQRPQLSPRK